MPDRIARWQPDPGAAATARAAGALALAGLAVIHVVDLPGTLGPTPLAGLGISGSSPRGEVARHRKPGRTVAAADSGSAHRHTAWRPARRAQRHQRPAGHLQRPTAVHLR